MTGERMSDLLFGVFVAYLAVCVWLLMLWARAEVRWRLDRRRRKGYIR